MAASTVTAASLGRGPQHFPASADLLEIREALDRDGLVVLRDVIDSSLVARINAELDPLLTETPLGCEHADEEMGEFLGPQTKRLNETLTRSPTITQHLVAQPRVIEVAESVLKEHCTSILVHQSQVFEQYPGETAQPFHRDDGLWPVEGARFPMSMTAFFALGEYTADVGATRALLGSHRWLEALHYEPKREGGWGRYNRPPREPAPEEIAVVEMPPGSAAIWVGPLLHAGGANITADRVRRGFIMAYSLGWLRGELNQQLMWPPEVARHFPREVQRLIGYAVEAPLIGCLEMGQDPIVLLESA